MPLTWCDLRATWTWCMLISKVLIEAAVDMGGDATAQTSMGAPGGSSGGDAAHPTAPKSSLFNIRRIFSVSAAGVTSSGHSKPKQCKILAMAVHTHEKKQLLAMALGGDDDDESATDEDATTATAGATWPASKGSANAVAAAAPQLLIRTIEEDQQPRFWRLPVVTKAPKKSDKASAPQRARQERLVALEFSPEGDWLAALSSRKNRLHLLPVLKLVSKHRIKQLDHSFDRSTANRELMSVYPSAMNTQMAQYLRATNEAGGLNGARYHSQVAGDDEQMSTLEFAIGMGTVRCLRWWRSMNGKNYCLVGGTDNIISIVNVEENAEECRCELQNAGAIVSIDLMHESFGAERRTSMLVRSLTEDNQTRFYRVVLEKKYQQPPKASDSNQSDASGSAEASGVSSTFGPGASIKWAVKTFPQHFLQDADFRPQRIKKNSPHISLCAINGLLSTESSLALFDPDNDKVFIFSNFQWSLKAEYHVPKLTAAQAKTEDAQSSTTGAAAKTATQNQVKDVTLSYSSSDLMLLQGNVVGGPKSRKQSVSTWVALPSRLGPDEPAEAEAAHIVHYLTLYENESIQRVLQSTSRRDGRGQASSSSSEIIYILQTDHHVYECRPQWSRVALFKALKTRDILLRDALSIGYALGVDMSSLCEVVADTIADAIAKETAFADDEWLAWVRDLYAASRAYASKAVETLARIGGAIFAIEFAQQVLAKYATTSTPPASCTTHFTVGSTVDESELQRVATAVVNLIFLEQVRSNSAVGNEPASLRPELEHVQSRMEANEAWLQQFLETNKDYDAEEVVRVCLAHHQVDKAVTVGRSRKDVHGVLQDIIDAGLGPFVSVKSVLTLIDSGFAHALTHPSSRVILRSFSVATQVDVLLAHPPAILQQRHWISRNVLEIPIQKCVQLAKVLDPRNKDTAIAREPIRRDHRLSATDHDSAEGTLPREEEIVELFLTLLLRLNFKASHELHGLVADGLDGECDPQFNQQALEKQVKSLVGRYRPPVVIARCADFENWGTAACLYEAHGGLVDAVECRLQSHNLKRMAHSSSLSSPASMDGRRRRRQSSDASSVSSSGSFDGGFEDGSDMDAELQEQLRIELFDILTKLVIECDSSKVSEDTRTAILARLLVKWFEYGLRKTELEVFLIDPKIYKRVSKLLSSIFFAEVVHGILGVDNDAPTASVSATSADGLDDRDRDWIRRCHSLPFSGQFLFHVCVSFLERTDGHLGLVPAADTKRLLALVKDNVAHNDLMLPEVRVPPHSAKAIGKSDPLETHVQVFTCSHVFPKRIFEEEVLPEFEKRMNALPIPLFSTKQVLLAEFKRAGGVDSAIEAPCPVCCFNKIGALVDAQYRASQPAPSSPVKKPRPQQPQLYFLHRDSGNHSNCSLQYQHSSDGTGNARRGHEPWEW